MLNMEKLDAVAIPADPPYTHRDRWICPIVNASLATGPDITYAAS